MIINVRGTNGSGKSTTVKKFLDAFPYSEVFGALGPKRPEAYMVHMPKATLYVMGPYQTATGGVDALGFDSERLVDFLEKYQRRCSRDAKTHMIFEGVVISTYFGELGRWMEAYKPKVIVGFLDTSLQQCLQALGQRGTGDGRKNVESKIKAIEGARRRMDEVGIRTETLTRATSFEVVSAWVKENSL